MSGKAQQQSRIKELITRGREQGYLTYAEVNDHLPEDISDPEQVEDIIRMINDMGINVFESAPDADALLLAEADTDEAAAEEAAAALAAVETDIGRTTDPVRMYMREMGTVELLTREGEIEIAKRIEEGIREVMGAIAHFPGTVDYILGEYDRVTTEGGRLSDVLSGYIDPDDNIAAPTEEVPIPGAKAAAAKEESDDDEEESESGDDEEEAESGPDPVVAAQRFGAVSDQLQATSKVLKKNGRNHKESIEALQALAANAVMAGCKPEYFPVVTAALRGVLDPEYNLHGTLATTHSCAPMVMVSGPIRHELNIICGTNCFGQGRQANATIGRAIRLMLLNSLQSLKTIMTHLQNLKLRKVHQIFLNQARGKWLIIDD